MTEREHYGYWDICFTDQENRDAIKVVEQMSLCSKQQAERTAKSWQQMTWTEGRKYFCRPSPSLEPHNESLT